MFDPEKFGEAMGAAIREAVTPLLKRIETLEKDIEGMASQLQSEIESFHGAEPRVGPAGPAGAVGPQGEKGADGLGLAGAMIDRDGALQITLSNGEVKSLGPVVGKDGSDGLSLDGFELEYLSESHEIEIKATAGGRKKELRYPAGGIRPAGYWRDGSKAKAGEAWVNDGSLWIALKDCQSMPGLGDSAWILAARRGRNGEDGRAPKAPDTTPIKLGK